MESGAELRADELTELVWNTLDRSCALSDGGGTGAAEAGADALLLARFLADPGQDGDRA